MTYPFLKYPGGDSLYHKWPATTTYPAYHRMSGIGQSTTPLVDLGLLAGGAYGFWYSMYLGEPKSLAEWGSVALGGIGASYLANLILLSMNMEW